MQMLGITLTRPVECDLSDLTWRQRQHRRATCVDRQVFLNALYFLARQDLHSASLAQAKNKQTSSCVHRYILLAIHRIRHRTGLDRRTDGSLPKQLTVASVKGKEISLASAAEQQIRSSRQDAGLRYISHLELPLHFTGVRIKRSNSTVSLFLLPKIRSRRPIKGYSRPRRSPHITPAWPTTRDGKHDKHRGGVDPGGDVEQTSAWAVRGGIPTGSAWVTRRNEGSFRAGDLARKKHGSALFIKATGPGHRDEGFSQQELARRAIKHIEEAVAVGPQYDLAWLALPFHVGQNRDLYGIIVELVVWRELVVPFQLAGIGV